MCGLYSVIYLHIWLAVHRSITFYYYQLDTQISNSFTQITLIKILYMFRAHSAHHQAGGKEVLP
jgi:hypothetical protein